MLPHLVAIFIHFCKFGVTDERSKATFQEFHKAHLVELAKSLASLHKLEHFRDLMKKTWRCYLVYTRTVRFGLAFYNDIYKLLLVAFVNMLVDFSELFRGKQIAEVLLELALIVGLDLVAIHVVFGIKPVLPLMSLAFIAHAECVMHLF